MKIRNNKMKLRFLAISALVLASFGGGAFINSQTPAANAAQLPAGTLVTNFVHPDAATFADGGSFTFTADVSAGATECSFNVSMGSGMGDSYQVDIVAGQVSYTTVVNQNLAYSFSCSDVNSDYDSVIWFFMTTLNTDSPTKPIFNGAPVVGSDGSVQIKWDASTDADGISGYSVYFNNYNDSLQHDDYESGYINVGPSELEATIPASAYAGWNLASGNLYVTVVATDNFSPLAWRNSMSSDTVSVAIIGSGTDDTGNSVELEAPNTAFGE